MINNMTEMADSCEKLHFTLKEEKAFGHSRNITKSELKQNEKYESMGSFEKYIKRLDTNLVRLCTTKLTKSGSA